MQIVASEKALARVRHQYRQLAPSVPAAHVSEALAAALGHGSSIALVASLRAGPRSSANLVALAPERMAERLRELGHDPAPDAGALRQAVLAAGALAEGPGYDDLGQPALDPYRFHGSYAAVDPARPKADWAGMTNAGRFAHMASTLWGSFGPLDFVENHADRGGAEMHRRLAAALALHADADPDMASFLVEVLGEASRLARPGTSWDRDIDFGDDGPDAELRWGDAVWLAFKPRFAAFVDAACRRWDPAVDPLSLEPEWTPRRRGARPRRGNGPRYPELSVALTEEAKECRLGLRDTGRERLDREAVIGLACFALWRHGVPLGTMREFADQARRAEHGLPDLVAEWVDLDGTAGSEASRAALADALRPKHPIHNLVAIQMRLRADPAPGRRIAHGWVVTNDAAETTSMARVLARRGSRVARVSGPPATLAASMEAAMRPGPDVIVLDGRGHAPEAVARTTCAAAGAGHFVIVCGVHGLDRMRLSDEAWRLRIEAQASAV